LEGFAMTEKENPPVKLRKLKKIDEYIEKIPVAWRLFQREIERGTDQRKAELKAVKRVYPGDRNSSTTLRIWREYNLWPPSEGILSGGDFGDVDSRIQGKNGLRFIKGGAGKVRRLRDLSEDAYDEPELSEKEILRRVRKILDSIEVHHREWTGGRTRRKYSIIKTKIIAGRLPVDLLNEIHKFKGSNTYHLERALRLYVKVMRAKD
jgi:hypothetical protein